ncbi:MAG: hypothetical protein LQ343_007517 [Gyalolechia ehrenbergii]|nr:MAG: hypothetical protein LQ343_007517 [Gyalolechia ehrenbergii]
MAPSSGHMLVPKALRIFKFAVTQAGALIRSRLPQASTGAADGLLQPIYLHAKVHPIHPIALLKQSRAAAIRRFSSQARLNTPRFDRPSFQKSKIGQAVTRNFGSPFASTLRPNLTGGALPRTAGGYTLGGGVRGVRHFSNTGGAQAQVIQNVSAGLRAFCVGGAKARFDGVDQKTGAKRFKAVSKAEDEALRKMEKPTSAWIKGTNLEFRLNPTVTALSASFPESTGRSFEAQTLGSDGFLDTLGIDFVRALKDLSAIHVDLKRLAAFGDLPISLTTSSSHGSTLSVRFAGCDADTVSRLCDEVGVRRGVIREDEAWNDDKDVEMALLFPFAPNESVCGSSDGSAIFTKTIQADHEIAPEQLEWRNMMSPSHHRGEHPNGHSTDYNLIDTPGSTNTSHLSFEMPTPRSSSGYESLRESDCATDDPYYHQNSSPRRHRRREAEGVQGLESIYRFLAECDEARR